MVGVKEAQKCKKKSSLQRGSTYCRIELAEVKPLELFTGMKPANRASVTIKQWKKHFSVLLLNPERVPPIIRPTLPDDKNHSIMLEFTDKDVKQVFRE